MIKFEKVKKYKDIDIPLPERKTAKSAGYDFVVAKDILIPSYLKNVTQVGNSELAINSPKTIQEVKEYNKFHDLKLTLVPTGMKCYLEPGTYLELSVRSSTPLNTWLMLANGVGIIDADYVDNPDNEGEIFFQLINFSPFDIQLKKGDIIGQGIVKKYLTTDNDRASGERVGGFGSTTYAINRGNRAMALGLHSQVDIPGLNNDAQSYYASPKNEINIDLSDAFANIGISTEELT